MAAYDEIKKLCIEAIKSAKVASNNNNDDVGSNQSSRRKLIKTKAKRPKKAMKGKKRKHNSQ